MIKIDIPFSNGKKTNRRFARKILIAAQRLFPGIPRVQRHDKFPSVSVAQHSRPPRRSLNLSRSLETRYRRRFRQLITQLTNKFADSRSTGVERIRLCSRACNPTRRDKVGGKEGEERWGGAPTGRKQPRGRIRYRWIVANLSRWNSRRHHRLASTGN